MTEPIPFPASPYCRVRARVASIWADGPDDGTHPDWRPDAGEKVTLTPSIGSQLLTYDVGGADPIIVTVERVDCVVGEDGFLTKSDGRPVYIAPTDDPLLSATGWTWTATIKGKAVPFSAPTGGVVDLAMFVAAPAADDTKTWVERIPELVALIEAGTDLAAIGASVEDYLAANPPVSDATADTKGILQLAGDLGGTADAPTVPGLADKADADHGHAIDDVTGLVDLSDKVDRIERNGDYLYERFSLDEPGDSYDIPFRWKVTNFQAGMDGAVLNTVYGERVLGQYGWADEAEWEVKSLYGKLTLVSGSISSGIANYEDYIYTPHSHLSHWDPHPMYAMKESLPAIIVGPGRPDTPATTGGAITGSEPVGAEYRSTDGAGVGAWVWMKRPTGWVVTDGDTGWRVVDAKLQSGADTKLQTRRVGVNVFWMHGMTANFRMWSVVPTTGVVYANKLIANGIVGFRPQERVQTIIWDGNSGEQIGVISITHPADGGYIAYGVTKVTNFACFSVSAATTDPWPTTLPGTPA